MFRKNKYVNSILMNDIREIQIMNKNDIINILVKSYSEDEENLKTLKLSELKDLLNEYRDHSDMFPNDDEDDGSHSWD